MKRLLPILAAAIVASAPAWASDKSDALAVAHQWADAFNSGDAQGMTGTCIDDAIIIDDFAPHVWHGAGTCATWLKDYRAFGEKNAIKDAKVMLGKARHADIDAGTAYLVVSAIETYSQAGKPVKQLATITLAMKKTDGGWRISGWAWADL